MEQRWTRGQKLTCSNILIGTTCCTKTPNERLITSRIPKVHLECIGGWIEGEIKVSARSLIREAPKEFVIGDCRVSVIIIICDRVKLAEICHYEGLTSIGGKEVVRQVHSIIRDSESTIVDATDPQI